MNILKTFFSVLILLVFCFMFGCVASKEKIKFALELDKRANYDKETQLTMKQAKLGPITERVGLIIAPGRYKSTKIEDSGYIQENFEVILNTMDDKFDYVYSTPSIQAKLADNEKKIKRCLASCGKNTLLVVFLAGKVKKVDEKYYILSYDSEPGKIPETSLDIAEVLKTLDDSGCGRILIFADLYPDGKAPGELIKYLANLPCFDKRYDLSREMRLLVTNFSAKDKPYRFYIGFQGADIFSWHLAIGLRGQADKVLSGGNNDGKTSVDELIQYIREEMASSLIYKQKPSSIGNFSANTFIIK